MIWVSLSRRRASHNAHANYSRVHKTWPGFVKVNENYTENDLFFPAPLAADI